MNDSRPLTSVSLMMLVALINAIDACVVRLLSPDVHPFVMGFTRTLFGALAILPMILRRPAMLRSHWRGLHLLRAILKLGSLVALFGALAGAPLATVTAIGFAAPLFVMVGAWIFLAERPHPLRLLAVAVGFVGIIVILRPGIAAGQGGANPFLLLALASAAMTAAIQLLLKVMGRRDPATTLVAWNLIVTVPVAAIPAAFFWSPISAEVWALLALQGAIGAANQTLVTRALQMADASLIAPLDFLRLPLVATLAFVFFGEVIGAAVWIGAMLILAATVLIGATARSGPAAAGIGPSA
ncbi:DMT family transporter [Paracoccus rhizosphaerae]|uniref:DMT family transporter n=1 Tax=Paracoccus rhizosphaerae TaxID=1133347 RepID=A0ABV6CK71_9RHOB|nr:DMT family transporter [Paracoccus rhizosphaerae]